MAAVEPGHSRREPSLHRVLRPLVRQLRVDRLQRHHAGRGRRPGVGQSDVRLLASDDRVDAEHDDGREPDRGRLPRRPDVARARRPGTRAHRVGRHAPACRVDPRGGRLLRPRARWRAAAAPTSPAATASPASAASASASATTASASATASATPTGASSLPSPTRRRSHAPEGADSPSACPLPGWANSPRAVAHTQGHRHRPVEESRLARGSRDEDRAGRQLGSNGPLAVSDLPAPAWFSRAGSSRARRSCRRHRTRCARRPGPNGPDPSTRPPSRPPRSRRRGP